MCGQGDAAWEGSSVVLADAPGCASARKPAWGLRAVFIQEVQEHAIVCVFVIVVALHKQARPAAAQLRNAGIKQAGVCGLLSAALLKANAAQGRVLGQPVDQRRCCWGAPVEITATAHIQKLQRRRSPQHSKAAGQGVQIYAQPAQAVQPGADGQRPVGIAPTTAALQVRQVGNGIRQRAGNMQHLHRSWRHRGVASGLEQDWHVPLAHGMHPACKQPRASNLLLRRRWRRQRLLLLLLLSATH